MSDDVIKGQFRKIGFNVPTSSDSHLATGEYSGVSIISKSRLLKTDIEDNPRWGTPGSKWPRDLSRHNGIDRVIRHVINIPKVLFRISRKTRHASEPAHPSTRVRTQQVVRKVGSTETTLYLTLHDGINVAKMPNQMSPPPAPRCRCKQGIKAVRGEAHGGAHKLLA